MSELLFVAALTAESTRRGAATRLVGDARQSTSATTTSTTACVSSEAVSVVRCDQRARRSVNETAMSDVRAAQRRVHFARGGLVCDECRGRQLLPWSPLPHRQIAISTRRGATVSLHLCLCVLPTHVNRSSSCSCTASLFSDDDDDDDDAGQTAVCSAPCSTPTARRRAASARRRPGVCTTRARRSSQLRRRALPARIGGARRQERRRVRAAARSRPSRSSLTRSALARARRWRRRHALLWATAAARWSSVPSSTATRCSSACSSSHTDPRA